MLHYFKLLNTCLAFIWFWQECNIVLVYDGTTAQGSWGMQAVKEMQVMELMLNRCDRMLQRQSCPMYVKNITTEMSRSKKHP